jgi:hypothetical protein
LFNEEQTCARQRGTRDQTQTDESNFHPSREFKYHPLKLRQILN